MATTFNLGDEGRVLFWRQVKALYDRDRFCDLRLVCKDGLSVLCHRIVMASVSKILSPALRATAAHEEDNPVATVVLPDLSHREVKNFVDFVYGILAMSFSPGHNFTVSPSVVDILEADLSALNLPKPTEEVTHLQEEEEDEDGRNTQVSTEKVSYTMQFTHDGILVEQSYSVPVPPVPPISTLFASAKSLLKKKPGSEPGTTAHEMEQGEGGGKGREAQVKVEARSLDEKRGIEELVQKVDETDFVAVEIDVSETKIEATDQVEEEEEEQPSPPDVSNAALIVEALEAAEEKRLTLEGLFDKIMETYPYFRTVAANPWQGGIRKELSMNTKFTKVGGSGKDKNHYWTFSTSSKENKESNVRCDVCGLEYRTQDRLMRHMNNEHPEEPTSVKKKVDLTAHTEGSEAGEDHAEATPTPAAETAASTPVATPANVSNLQCGSSSSGAGSRWIMTAETPWGKQKILIIAQAPSATPTGAPPTSATAPVPVAKSSTAASTTSKAKSKSSADVKGKRKSGSSHTTPIRAKRKMIKCDHCDQKFENWGQLKEHVPKAHPKKSLWGFSCEKCSRLFALKEDLNLHIVTQHHEDCPWKCQVQRCNAFYLAESSLKRHMTKHHGPGTKEWRPRGGWGGKGGRKRLKNSKTLVDGATGKKTHLCETCGRLDENLTTHYNHMREHVNVPCKICGREFHGLSKMKKHKNEEHPEHVTCDDCGQVYASKAVLQRHKLRVHTPNDDRPVGCTDCDRRFASWGDLRSHRLYFAPHCADFNAEKSTQRARRLVIRTLLDSGLSVSEVARQTGTSRTTVGRVRDHGVDRKNHKRRNYARSPELVAQVAQMINASPNTSIRALARETGISATSMGRLVKEDLGMRSYAKQERQMLSETTRRKREERASALVNHNIDL